MELKTEGTPVLCARALLLDITHFIDESSPLFGFSEDKMNELGYISALVSGIDPQMQLQVSQLHGYPGHLWTPNQEAKVKVGHRHADLFSLDRENKVMTVDAGYHPPFCLTAPHLHSHHDAGKISITIPNAGELDIEVGDMANGTQDADTLGDVRHSQCLPW